jgi:hypothetical protein
MGWVTLHGLCLSAFRVFRPERSRATGVSLLVKRRIRSHPSCITSGPHRKPRFAANASNYRRSDICAVTRVTQGDASHLCMPGNCVRTLPSSCTSRADKEIATEGPCNYRKSILRVLHLRQEEVVTISQFLLIPSDLSNDSILPSTSWALWIGIRQTSATTRMPSVFSGRGSAETIRAHLWW